jgi:O-antigen ligase
VQRALLIILVAASYLLLAGGPRWTLPPLLGLAALAACLAPRQTFSFPAKQRWLDRSLIALLCAIALQAVPLPRMLVAIVSPHAPVLRDRLRLPTLGAANPQWLPLSLDAEATLYALGTTLLGVLTFWVTRAALARGGARRLCRAIAFIGALLAITASVHRATAPHLVFGFVRPEAYSTSPFGAFLNRNHFAAWLLMIGTVGIGYLLAHLHIHPTYRESWRAAVKHFLASGAMLVGIAVTTILGVLMLTLSRSALAALGAATLCGGWLGRARMRVERNAWPAVLILAGIALVVVMTFVDVDRWAGRLQQGFDTSDEWGRVTIWRESVPILREFPLTGVGAGTYSTAMIDYQQTRVWVGSVRRWAHFNNAHSHYIQAAAEGGLLILIPAASALFWVAILGLRTIRTDKGEMYWMRIGAAAGLCGLAVQSIWEVSLIMPANTVLCGVLAGLLLYHRDIERQPSTTSTLRSSALRAH